MRFIGAIFAIFGFGPGGEAPSEPGYVSVRDESTALATLHDARMGIALVNDELVASAVLRDR